jgi:hypothetical protein
MSWAAYPQALIDQKGFISAGIYGKDYGEIWGQAGASQPSDAEVKAIVQGLKDGGSSLQATGIYYGGEKYMKIGMEGVCGKSRGEIRCNNRSRSPKKCQQPKKSVSTYPAFVSFVASMSKQVQKSDRQPSKNRHQRGTKKKDVQI